MECNVSSSIVPHKGATFFAFSDHVVYTNNNWVCSR